MEQSRFSPARLRCWRGSIDSRALFPSLTAKQVKEIIMKSSFKPEILVMPPLSSGFDNKMPLSKLSKSGGIVNAYNAVKMADEMVNGIR